MTKNMANLSRFKYTGVTMKQKRIYKQTPYIYMMVTNDELELPVIVESTVREFARKVGITTSAVYMYFYGRDRHPERKPTGVYKYVRIEE